MGRLRFWHTPRPIKGEISDDRMEQLYPTLVRIGVTPTTDIWAAMELVASKLTDQGGR